MGGRASAVSGAIQVQHKQPAVRLVSLRDCRPDAQTHAVTVTATLQVAHC